MACDGGGEDVASGTGGSAFLFEEVLLGFVGVVTRCGGFGFGCRVGFGGFDKLVHMGWKRKLVTMVSWWCDSLLQGLKYE